MGFNVLHFIGLGITTSLAISEFPISRPPLQILAYFLAHSHGFTYPMACCEPLLLATFEHNLLAVEFFFPDPSFLENVG